MPIYALQRTPGFAVQLRGVGCGPTGSVTGCAARHEAGTDRAFALRRRAHSRAPRPESLSFGSLGAFPV